MPTEVELRVEKFVKDHLSPKSGERDLISDRYAVLSDMLKGIVFQSGSYPRYTSLTPVNDLDVIWQLPDSLRRSVGFAKAIAEAIDPLDLDVENMLAELETKLEEQYRQASINVRIRAQSHSVGVYFGKTDEEFSIDIVPAIPTGNLNEFDDAVYLVPDIIMVKKSKRIAIYDRHDPIKWITSDPRGYKTAAERLNAVTASYRRSAKIIKAWKRACKQRHDTFPLKSFHLEMIANHVTSTNTMLETIAAVQGIFAILPSCVVTPRFPDRADDSRFIDAYIRDIDEATRRLILSEITQAETIMTQVGSETDPDKAERAIRRLIGYQVPAVVTPAWTSPATTRPYHAGD